ncbi:MAG: 4-(cytidine 5'-diphospho)-2-C-methyl-D-erythritol kinase [Acidobacteriota bacterium]
MPNARSARVRALAKINLALKVLGTRPDGYHELRTVFQTVSLADTLHIAFTPARRTSIAVACNVDIPGGNLVERAAQLALDAMRRTGRVEMRLTKRIPMGAGLGGGSSDAAAVLLALPALAGRALALATLSELAACLGSDVPFFLLGGTAVALGRGTELYPLPDRRAAYGLVIAPGIHVSTPQAYRDLDAAREAAARRLTSEPPQNMISSFQSFVWEDDGVSARLSGNDFETVVFRQHPRLGSLKRQLGKLGARPAMLSGSGSALYGVFETREQAERARKFFGKEEVFPIRFVTRAAYRALWRRRLGTAENVWPPQSQFA